MKLSIFAFGALVIAAGFGTVPAQAQNYPWCAHYGRDGGTNCGFTTFQQCTATVSGTGGFCEQNTQYRPQGGGYYGGPYGSSRW
jgi:hypothetical protein